jgi:hypothetical protein
MKFVFISYENYSASIAKKLIDEGNEVEFAQIKDKKDTILEDESYNQEPDEQKNLRLSLFDGILNKIDAKKLLLVADEIKNKSDYFVFTDSNDSFNFTEKLESFGFTGLLPTRNDRELEVNRDLAKELVKEKYPDISVKDYIEFKKIEDGIGFLEKSDNKVYVLKSLGDSGETVVPKGNIDAKQQNEILISTLKTYKKDYETNGFILEQKIVNGVEFTPQIVFYDGEPVYTMIDIETKTRDAGELGVSVGCSLNLIIKTEIENEFNKIFFPEFVYNEAKKRKGMFVWDINLIYNKDDGKFYFLEFCPMRVGWDSFPTEISMSRDENGIDASNYFNKIIKKENPLNYKFGVGIRFFNENVGSDFKIEKDIPISYDKSIEKDLYLYDAKLKDNNLVVCGYQFDVGVVTGVSNDLYEAIDIAYDNIKKISFKDIGYRFKDDFLSLSYPQSILNRYEFLIKNGIL